MLVSRETFAGALARNSDKLQGIVAGVERMTGGTDKGRLAMFDLSILSVALPLDTIPATQLTVPENHLRRSPLLSAAQLPASPRSSPTGPRAQ